MVKNMWLIFSIISCVLASIMQIFNKKVLNNVDPLVTTYLKNGLVFLFSFSLLFFNGTFHKVIKISRKTFWGLVILAVITFLTYLFFYFALKNGPLNKVMAIDRFSLVIIFFFLWFTKQEKIGISGILGSVLVFLGLLLIMLKKP